SGTYTQVIQNAAGCDSTITLTLTLDFTGLNETNKLNFSWFPNPTSDALNVEVDEVYLGETLHFYSADGRLVQTVVLSEEILSIDVKELTNGSYVCRLTNEANVVFRWIKN
ncbi:MAG: T9SS type A sorting domain-containing protein, partial [Flavobacteriales bacterium]